MPRHISSLASMLFGRFASHSFRPSIQGFINRSYVRLMGLDMREFSKAEDYGSLNELFTRKLEKDREFDKDALSVISPCDSLVTERGRIEKRHAYQIKGMSYDTACLLGPEYTEQLSSLESGEYINLYLSPKDYHRYHMPFDAEVLSLTHIPGRLYPVNMPLLKYKKNLFVENERVVIRLRDSLGKTHFIVLVGALNVGSMVVSFEKRLRTNISERRSVHFAYDEPVVLRKGELFGWFEMGSTIVMLSETGSIGYSVSSGTKLSYGDTIGRLTGAEK